MRKRLSKLYQVLNTPMLSGRPDFRPVPDSRALCRRCWAGPAAAREGMGMGGYQELPCEAGPATLAVVARVWTQYCQIVSGKAGEPGCVGVLFIFKCWELIQILNVCRCWHSRSAQPPVGELGRTLHVAHLVWISLIGWVGLVSGNKVTPQVSWDPFYTFSQARNEERKICLHVLG